jgi:two-component system OmpR family response regulator
MAAATILIVDDETEFSGVIAERLRGRGFDVDTAESGMEALGKVKGKSYDAVVLDLAMPEMDGIETLTRLLEIDKNLQVIMLTGRATVQKGVEAIKLGAVDFLEKPADITALIGKVTAAQEKRMAIFESDLEKKMSNLMKKKEW